MLETPVRILQYFSECVTRMSYAVAMESDNLTGDPDNQQGRLESYLSGFADGEGTFSIGLSRRPDLRNGFQLVHEFRVSQNLERASILEHFVKVLGCGSIRPNHRGHASDRSMVYVVRRRSDLIETVIPFFRRNPLLSEKRRSFSIFATVVEAMAAQRHHTREGFIELVKLAYPMNGEGAYRKWPLSTVIRRPEPSETVRQTPVQHR